MAKPDFPKAKYTSGIGTLGWPHLHAPDTRFVKDGDKPPFKAEITLSAEESAPLLKIAKALITEARKKGLSKSPPKMPATKNDDGTYTFNVKTFSKPALFDAAGQPITREVKVGGGTRARVSGQMKAYEGFGATGVTLYINAVQIIELKEFGGTAESYGFDAVEGFTSDDSDGGFDEDLDDDFGDDDTDEGGSDDELDF